MRAFTTFAVAWFLSMVAAQFLALQLAIRFGTRDELVLVMFIVGAFAAITLAVLAMAFIAGEGVRPVDTGAGIAGLLALALVCGILMYGMARNDWSRPTGYDMHIIVEILLPALLIVLIQWWLVRRYRLRNVE